VWSIKEGRADCMRALVVCVCMLVASVCVCEAVDVETRALGKCGAGEHLAQERALENATLHAQIYDWANQRDCSHWDFAREGHASTELLALFDVSGSDAAALECVNISYQATINLPGIFSSLLSVFGVPEDIPLKVEKLVCKGTDLILEDAIIQAPVVGQVHMRAKHTLHNGNEIVSVSHTVLSLPWYALPFTGQTSAALDHSVSEKFGAILKSLCKVDEGVLIRRKLIPKLNQTFDVSPLVPDTKVRRFPLVRTDKANLDTLKLGRVGLRRMARSASAPEVWV
jgi:hypothetical protein